MLAFVLLLAACLPAGWYRLEPLAEGEEDPRATGDLEHLAEVELRYEPWQGWDLHTKLDLRYAGEGNPRVDLSRLMVRVDEGPWEPCSHPDGTDLEALILVLEPGATVRREVICEGVRRPYQALEIRFSATGTRAGGAVQLRFDGVSRTDPPA